MTDNEIKKALECCRTSLIDDCKRCNLRLENGAVQPFCTTTLIGNALDLINRLQAENERLRIKCENTQIGYNFAKDDIEKLKKDKYKLQKALNQSEDYRVIAKAEAYKEFAERLKEKTNWLFSSVSINKEIDNLLKEMGGD